MVMNTQEECDYNDKLNAARAMLAALREVVRIIENGDDIGNGDLLAIGETIAQAEAAGITVDGQ